MEVDYYRVLGVTRNCTKKDITNKYRTLQQTASTTEVRTQLDRAVLVLRVLYLKHVFDTRGESGLREPRSVETIARGMAALAQVRLRHYYKKVLAKHRDISSPQSLKNDVNSHLNSPCTPRSVKRYMKSPKISLSSPQSFRSRSPIDHKSSPHLFGSPNVLHQMSSSLLLNSSPNKHKHFSRRKNNHENSPQNVKSSSLKSYKLSPLPSSRSRSPSSIVGHEKSSSSINHAPCSPVITLDHKTFVKSHVSSLSNSDQTFHIKLPSIPVSSYKSSSSSSSSSSVASDSSSSSSSTSSSSDSSESSTSSFSASSTSSEVTMLSHKCENTTSHERKNTTSRKNKNTTSHKRENTTSRKCEDTRSNQREEWISKSDGKVNKWLNCAWQQGLLHPQASSTLKSKSISKQSAYHLKGDKKEASAMELFPSSIHSTSSRRHELSDTDVGYNTSSRYSRKHVTPRSYPRSRHTMSCSRYDSHETTRSRSVRGPPRAILGGDAFNYGRESRSHRYSIQRSLVHVPHTTPASTMRLLIQK